MRALFGALLVVVVGCALVACGGAPPPRMVGAAEEAGRQTDFSLAKAQMDEARHVDFNTIRLDQTWMTGERVLGAGDAATLGNAIKAAKLDGLRVVLSIYPIGSSVTPISAQAQGDFAAFAAGIAQQYPYVHDFIVGNEPNINRFWLPQFGPSGEDSAAVAYEELLAVTFDALKRVRPHSTVYGGALAPRGGDKPNTGRDTHSPTTFITDLGTAYRSSGRTRPIMDAFTFHPYPETAATGPRLAHPHTTAIGLADHAKLVQLLAAAFDGTAQAGSNLPILYDEFGVETAIPAAKAALYTGSEPVTTHPVDEVTQARIYASALQIASCQQHVLGLLLFHVQDEPDLTGWQSGEFYADGTAKASLSAVRTAVHAAQENHPSVCARR